MTTVLVAYGSRLGSTKGIAERIAARLRTHGIDTTACDVQTGFEPGRYDAFVIGSAVYAGHWLKDVTRRVGEHTAVLSARPVWLFSSGPSASLPPARHRSHRRRSVAWSQPSTPGSTGSSRAHSTGARLTEPGSEPPSGSSPSGSCPRATTGIGRRSIPGPTRSRIRSTRCMQSRSDRQATDGAGPPRGRHR